MVNYGILIFKKQPSARLERHTAMEDDKPVKQPSRALIILGLLVICAVGYLLFHQKSTDIKSYSPGNFGVFRLAGTSAGTGISFQKPKEFAQTSNTLNLKTEAQFSDSRKVPVKDGIKLVNLAATSAVSVNADIDKAYVSSLKATLKNPNNDDYKKYVAPSFDFVKQRSLKTTDLKFENAKLLVQPNLNNKQGTKTAWLFKFSGTDKKHPGYLLKGDYVFIVSPKGFYYFFVMARGPDWDANQDAWTKIIDSIKVDQ
jgi:hypothetical protein